MKIAAKRMWTDDGFFDDAVITIEDGVVTSVDRGREGDVRCAVAAPGFIDQHVHGGFGVSVMRASPEETLGWLEFLLKNGVTHVLAGIYTAPFAVMRKALGVAREVMARQRGGAGGALLSGVHLEGPFISMDALGAMDPAAVAAPAVEAWRALTEGYEDIVRLVSLAPEVPGGDGLTRFLTARGIAVEAGHTAATDAQGRAAFAAGVKGITHFFNASTPIRHRAPGILAQALVEDSVYCECICDGVHVHDTAVRLIYRCKGPRRMIVVSDAVETTGLPDGVYEFGGEKSVVTNGESRTLTGALNGGGMTPLGEVRYLTGLGIPLWDALRMASRTSAEFLGLSGGAIEPGARAEIACLNDDLSCAFAVRGAHTAGEA